MFLRILSTSGIFTERFSVLIMAAGFEGYSWYLAHRALGSQKKRGETLWRLIRRSKDPTVFTVFLEDSAALTGIGLAFLGGFWERCFTILIWIPSPLS